MIKREDIERVISLVMDNYTITDEYLQTTPPLEDIADRVEADMVRKVGYAKQTLRQFGEM